MTLCVFHSQAERSNHILDGVQAPQRCKPAVVQCILNLVHPERNRSINSSRHFRGNSLDQFALRSARNLHREYLSAIPGMNPRTAQ
jgi:hypothetical protein